MKTGSNLLFFDFDGTLIDSINQYHFYYNDYARRWNKPIINFDDYKLLRTKSLDEVRKILGLSLIETFFIDKLLKKQVYQNPELIAPFPGIIEALKELSERGFLIYIISSNSTKNIKKILHFYDIHYVDKIIHTFRGFNKTYFIKKYLKKNKGYNQAFVISDEYKDIKAAKQLNITSIAVTWGANDFEQNNLIMPDYILNSSKELLSFILNINHNSNMEYKT